MNAVQCPTMAAASGLSETMTLDDDSGAHEGNDEDNGDDAYGIESHGEQDAIARQVQLLLDLDRLGQIIARNRSNSADRCLACARDRPSMVGATINRRDMNHSERNYEIQQLETSRHEAAKAVCLSAAALDDASISSSKRNTHFVFIHLDISVPWQVFVHAHELDQFAVTGREVVVF